MKDNFKLVVLLSLVLSFWGCTMQGDEISSLKIKVLNLETITQRHNTRLSELEKSQEALEKKLTEEFSRRFMDFQVKMLSDLEETRKALFDLQRKLEEINFQREGDLRTQTKALEDLKIRVDALELKVKNLEKEFSDWRTLNQTKLQESLKQGETKGDNLTPDTEKRDTVTQNKTIEKGQTLTEEDLYQRAFIAFEKGNLKEAKRLWEDYLKMFPKGKWVGQTHFYLGEIYMREKDYEAAILSYQKLIEQPGPNPLKARAMLRQAEAFLALKDKKAAQILYRKIIQNFPGTKEAEEAKKRLNQLR